MPHFIVIGDGNGRRARFLAKTLIRMTCKRGACGTRLWVDWKENTDPTRLGTPPVCFTCGSDFEVEWGEGQLVFVPEGVSDMEKLATGDLVEVEYMPTQDLKPMSIDDEAILDAFDVNGEEPE